MAIVESKKPPTSARGAMKSGKDTIGFAWFFALLAAGFGLFLLALPWLARIPLIGGIFEQGASIFPSMGGNGNGNGVRSTNPYGVRYLG